MVRPCVETKPNWASYLHQVYEQTNDIGLHAYLWASDVKRP